MKSRCSPSILLVNTCSGGPVTSIGNRLAQLEEAGWSCSLLAPSDDKRIPKHSAHTQLITTPTDANCVMQNVGQKLADLVVDIVECSDGEGVHAIKQWIQTQRAGKAKLPLVYTFRSEQLLENDSRNSKLPGMALENGNRHLRNMRYREETQKLATHYIGISKAILEKYKKEKFFPITKTNGFVVPNSLTGPFEESPTFPKNRNYGILYVGRIEEQKGVKTLVNAFLRLSQRKAEWAQLAKLTLIGKLNTKLLPSHPRIEIKKPQQHRSLIHEYRNAGVFFFGSHSEAFGNALLEAMSQGCCCDIDSNLELLGIAPTKKRTNPFVFQSGSDEELELKLAEILKCMHDLRCRTLDGEQHRVFERSKQYHSAALKKVVLETFCDILEQSSPDSG